ncbi:MAG: leucyl/phenylalanyl-tRNA--protein transferase [Proteobacteria bacterium]|nr:leucyl/phenylalanyl-tRNA--protein transferase [Pseudomonadota bacterium]MBI3497970.1 leucyl/phenylalanyl-tRNA--protein transferase [Pseudomonadota bacterium]
MTSDLTPELLLQGYAVGVFPMAERRDDPNLVFIEPDRRGILPLDRFHLAKSLKKTLKRRQFEVRCDTNFASVLEGCAEPTPERPDTWINAEIVRLYTALFEQGNAHSLEAWLEGELVGGLYGVALGGAFFGESMFSRVADASKVALAHLVARLRHGGFVLLDSQFVTRHLERFGAFEIGRAEYRRRLAGALAIPAVFPTEADDWPWVDKMIQDAGRQSSTQTS